MAMRPRPPPAWVLLGERRGGHIHGPSEAQRAEAVRELFRAGVEEPHGECFLEVGRDGGPLFHLVFTAARGARLEEWAPASHGLDTVLARVHEASGVTEDEALELWERLAAGDVDAVRRWRWR